MQIDARRCTGTRYLHRGRLLFTGPRADAYVDHDTRLDCCMVRCFFGGLVFRAAIALPMVIRTDVSALRRTKWYEYGIRFVVGGLITAIAGALASTWGPVIGGLFLAFPAI